MKRRQDCDCPCHRGGVAVHVVPCCEGMLSSLLEKHNESSGKRKKAAKRKPKVVQDSRKSD
jgi:hypothetical protein